MLNRRDLTIVLSLSIGAYIFVKLAIIVWFGYSPLVAQRPDAVSWNGTTFPVPMGTTLKVWPELAPYFGIIFLEDSMPDSLASGTGLVQLRAPASILFFSDTFYGLLEGSKAGLEGRFTWIGSINAKDSRQGLRLGCYCVPTRTASTGESMYVLRMTLADQPHSVEFIGPQSRFDDYFSVVSSALRVLDLVNNPADAVHACFASMRDRHHVLIEQIPDSVKEKRLREPRFNCPRIGRVRSGHAGT